MRLVQIALRTDDSKELKQAIKALELPEKQGAHQLLPEVLEDIRGVINKTSVGHTSLQSLIDTGVKISEFIPDSHQ